MVSDETIMGILCMLLYVDLMAYMYVKVFRQSGIRVNWREIGRRYKLLDWNTKRRIRGFLAILTIQYLVLLAGGLGLFILGLMFAPIIVAIVVLTIYQYSP